MPLPQPLLCVPHPVEIPRRNISNTVQDNPNQHLSSDGATQFSQLQKSFVIIIMIIIVIKNIYD
jgi:hypothetical protein